MVQQTQPEAPKKGREIWDSLTDEQKIDVYKDHLYIKFKALDDDTRKSLIIGMEKKHPGALDALKQGAMQALSLFGEQMDRVDAAIRSANQAGLSEIKSALTEGRPISLGYEPAVAFGKQLIQLQPWDTAPTGQDQLEELYDGMGIGLDPKDRKRVTEALMKELGESRLSRAFPGAFSETGEEWFKWQKGGWADISMGGFQGFLLESAQTGPYAVALAARELGKGIKSLVKWMRGVPVDMATVATRSKGVKKVTQALGETYDEVHSRHMEFLDPKYAADYEALVRIKNKHGIVTEMTEQAKFGKNSAPGLLERKKGGIKAQQLVEDIGNEVSKKLEGKLLRLSQGQAISPDQAGQMIIDGLNHRSKKIQGIHDFNYRSFGDANPDLMISPSAAKKLGKDLDRFENEIVKQMDATSNTGQLQQLKEALNDIKTIRANPTYDMINRKRQIAGQHGWNIGGAPPGQAIPGHQRFNQLLYTATSDALQRTIKESPNGAEILGAIKENNKRITEMFKREFALRGAMKEGASPEWVYNRYIRNGTGKEIARVKELLGPNSDQFNMIKAAYMTDMLNLASKTKQKSFAAAHDMMVNPFKGKAQYILNEQEFIDFTDLMWYAHRNNVLVTELTGMEALSQGIAGTLKLGLERKARTGSVLGLEEGETVLGALPTDVKRFTRAEEAETRSEFRRKLGDVKSIGTLEGMREKIRSVEEPTKNRSLSP